MVGIRGYQFIQVGQSKINSMDMRYMYKESRDQITQYWREEVFVSLDHSSLMCEMVDTYKYR